MGYRHPDNEPVISCDVEHTVKEIVEMLEDDEVGLTPGQVTQLKHICNTLELVSYETGWTAGLYNHSLE